MAHNWHYATGGEKHGPITAPQLKTLVMSGQLSPDDLVWRDDMKEWRKASTVKGLFPTQSTHQPTAPPLPILHSKNRSSLKKWLFIGGGSLAAFIVLITILTVTQTNAARNEIANAAILWEKGQHDEAVTAYQSVIAKYSPFIPNDQRSLVYGRVIDHLSQAGKDQEVRHVFETAQGYSSPVQPLVESLPGQQLMAKILSEHEAERQKEEAEQQQQNEKAALARATKNPVTLDKSGRVDFLDNTANYKGKAVRFECKWIGDGRRNRSTGRMTRLELLVFHNGGAFEVQVDVPDNLPMPNLQGSDYLFVTFLCEQGSLARGNVALKIERS